MTTAAGDSVTTGSYANEQLAEWQTTGKSGSVEGTVAYDRSSAFGEKIVQNLTGARTPMLAREGSYWVQTNVPGTPIADTSNVTAFAATTPTMVIFNNNSAASGRYVYPVRFKVQATTAGASGTNWLGQWLVDSGNRWTSGGTLLTVANPNLNVATTASNVVTHFGAITAPAANASRIIHSAGYRTVIKVVGDVTTFEFGTTAPVTTGMPMEGTLQLNQTLHLPPIALPPQCSLLWYEYAASQSGAAQFDYIQLEYSER